MGVGEGTMTTRIATCQCGQAALELQGAPILTTACYCASCQEAGRRLRALPLAQEMLTADGGTECVEMRKDRVRFLRGADFLREHRLNEKTPTRRVVAGCCNSAMFLEFTNGHWLSVYHDRLPEMDRPAVEMRVMTEARRAGVEFSDGLPSYSTHPIRFMWRLLAAWAAMRFRVPKIDYVKGGAIDGL